MSEPTPLSAEELADGDDFDTCSFGLDHDAIDRALAEQDATIDAQATEIAGLKGALTERDALLKALEPTIAYAMAHSWTEPDFAELERLRVLAGKEAQCPKCEGRGFIRTMVDGERDSEPCSFCRMSGLAGKGAQGA